jgi:hypothetical protein
LQNLFFGEKSAFITAMESKTNFWKIGLIALIILVIIGANVVAWYFILQNKAQNQLSSPTPTPTLTSQPDQKVCTQEVKECPDGSFVGRTGPNCEFTPCPPPSSSKADDEKAIKEAILKKLNSNEFEMKVTISQLTDKYAKGSVVDKEGIGGGYFIAAKTKSGWVIVHDGQANPTCAQLAPYDFPKDMVPECLDQNSNVVKR